MQAVLLDDFRIEIDDRAIKIDGCQGSIRTQF